MDKREMRRAASPHARRNRGLALGIAIPAVISVGALPAFASHSDDLDDEGDEGHSLMTMEGEETQDDEFAGARLVDPDEEIPEDEPDLIEDDYDAFAGAEEDDSPESEDDEGENDADSSEREGGDDTEDTGADETEEEGA